ncbi:MAG TPA: hypothetical protein VK106_02785 [Balneolaceae bacterium]|nr:hypothetical protein [Balneolaceae bacterium]
MNPENASDNQRQEWVERQLHAHLKKKHLNAPIDEKIELLKKRKRSRWWMLGINVAVILFFGYSFFFHITELSNTLFYILCAVFIINMVLIYYQTKQLAELIEWLVKKSQN